MSGVNKSRLIQVIAIGFILVICPAASWYYLQKGLDYQREARRELAAVDSIQADKFIPEYIAEDSTLLYKRLRIVVLNEYNNQNEITKLADKLQDQFEDSNGVMIIELVKSSATLSVGSTQKNSMHITKVIDSNEFHELSNNVIGNPTFKNIDGRQVMDKLEKGTLRTDEGTVFGYLIDQNNKVRNVYNLLDENRVKRMVEHTAILIPRLDKEDVELIREKEM